MRRSTSAALSLSNKLRESVMAPSYFRRDILDTLIRVLVMQMARPHWKRQETAVFIKGIPNFTRRTTYPWNLSESGYRDGSWLPEPPSSNGASTNPKVEYICK